MPYRKVSRPPATGALNAIQSVIGRAASGDYDYVWEPDPVQPVDASQTQAMTNDELKPNDAIDLVKKKKRRSLTVPLDTLGKGGDGLAAIMSSIGLNIPT
jgi:hypothetical protein